MDDDRDARCASLYTLMVGACSCVVASSRGSIVCAPHTSMHLSFLYLFFCCHESCHVNILPLIITRHVYRQTIQTLSPYRRNRSARVRPWKNFSNCIVSFVFWSPTCLKKCLDFSCPRLVPLTVATLQKKATAATCWRSNALSQSMFWSVLSTIFYRYCGTGVTPRSSSFPGNTIAIWQSMRRSSLAVVDALCPRTLT